MAEVYELSIYPIYNSESVRVPFLIPSQDLLDKIEAHMRVADLQDSLQPYPSLDMVRLQGPQDAPCPPIRLYEWFYPAGLSRWSIFRGLMKQEDYDLIEKTKKQQYALAEGASLTNDQMKVRFRARPKEEEGDTPIESSMYIVQTTRITADGVPEGLLIVTLADDRYQKQFDLPKAFFDATTDWTSLLEAIQDATVDVAVESEYGQPCWDSPLALGVAGPIGPVFDDAAASVGRVYCRLMDGTYKVVTWRDAHAYADADRDQAFVMLGGPTFTNESEPDWDRYQSVPTTLRVKFAKWWFPTHRFSEYDWTAEVYRNWEDRSGNPHVYDFEEVTVNTADLGYPYDGWTTGERETSVTTTAKIVYEHGTGSQLNMTACEDLAKQIAKDYCERATHSVDEVYQGIYTFDPRGGCDLTYSFRPSSVSTRVQCGAANGMPTHYYHQFTQGTMSSQQGIEFQHCEVVMLSGVPIPGDEEYQYAGIQRSQATGGNGSGFTNLAPVLVRNATTGAPFSPGPTERAWCALEGSRIPAGSGTRYAVYRLIRTEIGAVIPDASLDQATATIYNRGLIGNGYQFIQGGVTARGGLGAYGGGISNLDDLDASGNGTSSLALWMRVLPSPGGANRGVAGLPMNAGPPLTPNVEGLTPAASVTARFGPDALFPSRPNSWPSSQWGFNGGPTNPDLGLSLEYDSVTGFRGVVLFDSMSIIPSSILAYGILYAGGMVWGDTGTMPDGTSVIGGIVTGIAGGSAPDPNVMTWMGF